MRMSAARTRIIQRTFGILSFLLRTDAIGTSTSERRIARTTGISTLAAIFIIARATTIERKSIKIKFAAANRFGTFGI